MTADVGLFMSFVDRGVTKLALPVTQSLTVSSLTQQFLVQKAPVTQTREDDVLFPNMNVFPKTSSILFSVFPLAIFHL